jgi:hypothetical protein
MRSVMRDPVLEKEFQENGYVEIPFISQQEAEELKSKFFELLPNSGGNLMASEVGSGGGNEITYDFTFIDKNIDYKLAVYDVITGYFKPHVEKWLADYTPVIANYIRKQNDSGEVPLHENWAFVDERKYTSVSIWCPLVDSFEENGTLQVIPGSHKRFGEIRGPMIPWELEGIKNEIIDNYLVPLNVKSGNAIILDDSIIHYSSNNKTTGLRLAIQLILIPSEVPSIHYHMNGAKSKNLVEVLEVDTDFYMQFNPWKQPDGAKRIRAFEYEPFKMTIPEFEKRLSQPRFDENRPTPLLQRVKSLFTT